MLHSAYSEFRFSMQHELEELVVSQYSCPVKIIYVDPGKEPMMLLAHLHNSALYHLGVTSSSDVPVGSIMYQIRIEPQFGILRAYEVQSKEIQFTSEDAFLIGTHDSCSLWIGESLASSTDKINEFLVSHFPGLEWVVLAQGTEISGKWIVSLTSTANIHTRGPFDIHLTSSRLFRCCCSLGYFSIEEITGYGQDDLREDTCCILEVPPLNKLFLWRGREASDVVLSLVLKSISHRWSQENSSSGTTTSTITKKASKDFDYFSDSDDRVNHTQSCTRMSLDGSTGSFSKMKRHPSSRTAKSKSVSDVSELMPKGPRGEGSFAFIEQGKETLDFTCYFHGWDARIFEVVEPSNEFLTSIGKKRASH